MQTKPQFKCKKGTQFISIYELRLMIFLFFNSAINIEFTKITILDVSILF